AETVRSSSRPSGTSTLTATSPPSRGRAWNPSFGSSSALSSDAPEHAPSARGVARSRPAPAPRPPALPRPRSPPDSLTRRTIPAEEPMLVPSERTPLHVPELHVFVEDGITYAVDADAPNWVALDEAGARLLHELRSSTAAPASFGALVAKTAADGGLETGK